MRFKVTRLVVAGTLAVSACGSDNKSESTPAPPAQGSSGPSVSTGRATSGQPIKIGLANTTSGTNSFPGYVAGVDAAVAYVNAELGGINGRPLAVEHCAVDPTPESAQNCGQKFANDQSILFGLGGALFVGAPYYDAMGAAKKPVSGGIAISEADFTTPHARFYYGGAVVSIPAIPALAVRTVPNAKKALMVHEDGASGESAAKIARTTMDAAGVSLQTLPVARDAGDVLPQVTAMADESLDLIVLNSPPETCQKILQAMGSIKVSAPVFTNTTCLPETNVQAARAAGVSLDNFSLAVFSTPTFLAEGVDEELDIYHDKFPKYSKADAGARFTLEAWGNLLAVADILRGVQGDLTSASIDAALAAFKGPMPFGLASLACPGPANAPAVCGAGGAKAFGIKDYALVPLEDVVVGG